MSRAWWNGHFVPRTTPGIPTLTAGEGWFETILVEDGVPRLLEAHLDRLLRSADELAIPVPTDRESLRAACRTLAGEQADPGHMRVLAGRGGAAVTVDRFAGYPPEIYAEGVDVEWAEATGHPLGDRAGMKLLPYTTMLDARAAARDRGSFEVLFRDRDGVLLEGSASNLFLVQAGEILTPPADRPLLPGVTRAAVLAAARTLGLPCREVDLRPEHFRSADEAFLTGSLMKTAPIRSAGGVRVPLGEIAARLRREVFGR